MSTRIQKMLRRFATSCAAVAISAAAMISPTHAAPGFNVSNHVAVSGAEFKGISKTKQGGSGEGNVLEIVKIKGEGGDYRDALKTDVKIGIQDVAKSNASQKVEASNLKVEGATVLIGSQKVR